MNAAHVVASPGSIGIEERRPLSSGADTTVIAPKVVGLCGTDLEIIDGAIDPAYVRYPLVLGHEWSGTVISSSDPALAAGQAVVVEGIVPCRVCAACVAGATNLCVTYDEIGFTRDGAAAGEIAVRSDLVHPLRADIDLEHGALIEPAAVVYLALSRAGTRPGLDCLIVGDGTVALLAVHLLQLWSPSRTVVVGRRQAQAGLARAAGADDFVDSVPSGAFDLVVEAAGTPDAVTTALRATRRGGTVVLLGLPPHGSTVGIEPADLVNNDLTVRASFGYTSVAWREVVRLVNSRRLEPAFLVTHRFPLARFDEAIKTVRRPAEDAPRGKVVLEIA